MNEGVWNTGGTALLGENRIPGENPSSTLSITNPAWTGLFSYLLSHDSMGYWKLLLCRPLINKNEDKKDSTVHGKIILGWCWSACTENIAVECMEECSLFVVVCSENPFHLVARLRTSGAILLSPSPTSALPYGMEIEFWDSERHTRCFCDQNTLR